VDRRLARRVARRLNAWLAPVAGQGVTGTMDALLRRTALRAGVALVYHRVGTPGDDPERSLDPALDTRLFRAQLAHLARRHRIVTASRLPAAVRMRRRGEPFPVAVTFDDDLVSHVRDALPELRQATASATFFLNGASLDAPHAFWWERLQRAVEIEAELPAPAAGGGPIRATGMLVEELAPAERDAFAARLGELVGPDPDDAGLRADQVRALAEAGMEIGFHTRRHHRLPQLSDDELARELRNGRAEVEELAGAPLRAIAYPHGRADDRVAGAARAADYSVGFTTTPTAVTPASDPLLLGRVDAPFGSVGELATRVTRALVGALLSGPETGRRGADARRAALGERGGRAARRAIVRPPVGRVDLGDLRSTEPVSRDFGFARGTPVDRFYVERFLERHSSDVRGRVLEVGDDGYTSRFGGDAVEGVEVLDATGGNPRATVVADLTDAPELSDASFDCVICTQTLLLVYDLRAAVATLRRILRPGGVALVTLPGVSRTVVDENDPWEDHWRFTHMSARRLFEEAFGAGEVDVEPFGNVLAATAQLQGMAAEDLDEAELRARDPAYDVLIGVRARASDASSASAASPPKRTL
jgi:peptidoglycan/xylan/chitin deacetylase (PgdA/CDA1 family)